MSPYFPCIRATEVKQNGVPSIMMLTFSGAEKILIFFLFLHLILEVENSAGETQTSYDVSGNMFSKHKPSEQYDVTESDKIYEGGYGHADATNNWRSE